MKRLIDALGDTVTRMLTTQYRMNEVIMSWISERLYESRLLADASVAEHLLADLPGVARDEVTGVPVLLVDTDGCDMREMVVAASGHCLGDEESKANEGEANLVCRHVSDLVSRRVRPEEIAVITPYNLQMELIKVTLWRCCFA